MSSFSSIPILDLSLARSQDTKPAFLDELRYALMEVGFLYLKNVGIPDDLAERVKEEGKAFFDLPAEEKLVHAPARTTLTKGLPFSSVPSICLTFNFVGSKLR